MKIHINFFSRDTKRSLQGIVLGKLDTISILIPFVIYSVILSSPLGDTSASRPSVIDDKNEDFLYLLLAASDEQWKSIGLREYLSREWYEPWPQLEWVSKSLLTHLVDSVSKVPIISGCEKIVLKFASVFRKIASYLGPGFATSNLIPAFKTALPLLDGNSDAMFGDDSTSQVCTALFTCVQRSYFILSVSTSTILAKNILEE